MIIFNDIILFCSLIILLLLFIYIANIEHKFKVISPKIIYVILLFFIGYLQSGFQNQFLKHVILIIYIVAFIISYLIDRNILKKK